jgi:hypothetical protein
MTPPASPHVQLTPEQHAAMRVAIDRDAPWFADRLNRFTEIERVELPWFARHQILDVQSPVPFPARRVYVAVGAGGVRVLSQHLENLHAIAADDPPSGLDDAGNAALYASECNGLAAAYGVGELRIETFGEIPFYAPRKDAEQRVVDDLRARFEERIGPETRTRTAGGWQFQSWLIAVSSLIERTILVPPDGKLVRTDTMHASYLPIPYGNHWGLRDGRLVPIG